MSRQVNSPVPQHSASAPDFRYPQRKPTRTIYITNYFHNNIQNKLTTIKKTNKWPLYLIKESENCEAVSFGRGGCQISILTHAKKKNYSLCPNDQNTYFKPFLNIFIFNKKKLINQRDFFNWNQQNSLNLQYVNNTILWIYSMNFWWVP